MSDLQERYLDFLKKLLKGSYRLNRITYMCGDHILTDKEIYDGRFYFPHTDTMLSFDRLQNIQDCVIDVIEKNIPGDLIETGVWRGGACIFMNGVLKTYNIKNRNVWVADSFNGFPLRGDCNDEEDKNSYLHDLPELIVSLDEVKENFEYYNLLDDQVKFLPGFFKDTLPTVPVNAFSIVRLDGDLYESTMDGLVNLYPKLSKGGYLIVDDYLSIENCKRAVDEYRAVNNITDEIIPVDWTCVYWQKN